MHIAVVFNLNIFQEFFYKVPSEFASQIQIGMRIKVPFHNRTLLAIVTAFKSPSSNFTLKSVSELIDTTPIISKEMLNLGRWMSDYYVSPLGEILFAMFPPQIKKNTSFDETDTFCLNGDEVFLSKWKEEHKRKKTLLNFLEFLKKDDLWSVESVKKRYDHKKVVSMSKTLLKSGVLVPQKQQWSIATSERILTEEQNFAYQQIKVNSFQTYLLHGVTGSGKTEIYIRLVEDILKAGQSALILVPEISLIQQIHRIFCQKFPNAVALLHSAMKQKERHRMWWKVKRGDIPIVVGSRSAIFAPLKNLGIIIVDEEHDGSYKQDESNPRYSARDIAVFRGKNNAIPVVLGSATPSLESFYNAEHKKYTLIQMTKRIGEAHMPRTLLVDMRFDAKKNFFLSRILFENILSCLKKEEQIILFLNRRGFYQTLFCKSCSFTQECSYCSVSLTYHSAKQELKCHYCGFSREVFWKCPRCRLPLKPFGLGIQALEKNIKTLFPAARVGRLDTDITQKVGELEKILNDFSEKHLDILIGTQMISKGLDIHNVTLVGIIHADTGIYIPDFRSSEKTYQLIQQVSGRSGRGTKKGTVVIQTYQPDRALFSFALRNDFLSFYKQELKERQLLFYPPHSRLAEILIFGRSEKETESHAMGIKDRLCVVQPQTKNFFILGPVKMPLYRINRDFRWHILIKSDSHELLKKTLSFLREEKNRSSVKTFVNRDPFSML